jgi:hypothetical protein
VTNGESQAPVLLEKAVGTSCPCASAARRRNEKERVVILAIFAMSEVDLEADSRLRLLYKNVFDRSSRIFISFDDTRF